MKESLSSRYNQIEEKRKVLEEARIQLKKEFISIDMEGK
jgi:hypothetical protein